MPPSSTRSPRRSPPAPTSPGSSRSPDGRPPGVPRRDRDPGSPPRRRCDGCAGPPRGEVAVSALFVAEPGLLTTVQDLGRYGHQRVGVPTSGPMDRVAFVIANRLVGNADGAAALECTIKGPRLEVRETTVVAVAGAPMGFTVNGQAAPEWTAVRVRPGDVLGFQMASAGCRAYLAVAGGIDVPLVLGSRATYLRGRLGGLGGRALQKGDALPVGASPSDVTPEGWTV